MERAEDFGEYYRVPSDNRDLNYSQYFTEGEVKISELHDYNSHNTKQYDVKQMTEKLLTLDYIQKELAT